MNEEKYDKIPSQIFACALTALTTCITRFDGVGVRDIYERTYQAELYSILRQYFPNDDVGAEVNYNNKSKLLCDVVLYCKDKKQYWIEIKYWGMKDYLIDTDVKKLKKYCLGYDKKLILLTYWYEDKTIYKDKYIQCDFGKKQADTDYRNTWFAVLPAPPSDEEKYQADVAGCSMYLIG